MRKSIVSLVMVGLVLSFGARVAGAAEKGARPDLDARMHTVNDTVKKKGLMKDALKAVSVETGVPPAEIDRAITNRAHFVQNPGRHTYEE